MKIFITGTDTNVGKTLICGWIALHTGMDYWKPIQTGLIEGSDSDTVKRLSHAKIYPECYAYQQPLSPHLAARFEYETIDISKLVLPPSNHLIIEGAGGVFVPLNANYLMVDWIKKINVPVIVVARTALGTINHTLLTLEALKKRHIPVWGVIMNGQPNPENQEAIALYGHTSILAEFDQLKNVHRDTLQQVPLPVKLKKILTIDYHEYI